MKYGVLWFSVVAGDDGDTVILLEIPLEGGETESIHCPYGLYERIESEMSSWSECYRIGEFIVADQTTLNPILQEMGMV